MLLNRVWTNGGELINIYNNNISLNINQNRIKIFSIPIGILYITLAILTILWEFMLLSTALYFHDTFYKLMAAVIAVFFWYITYYVWYKPHSQSLLYPLTPKEWFLYVSLKTTTTPDL